MTSLDILYYSLALGFLVLVGFISYAAYHTAITLQSAHILLERVNDIVEDIQNAKNTVKSNSLGIIATVFGVLSTILKKL